MSNVSQPRNGSLSRSDSSVPRAIPALYTSISDPPTNLDDINALMKLGATTTSKLYGNENHAETTVSVLMYDELAEGLLHQNDTREHESVLSEANKSLPSLYEYLFSVVPLQVMEFEATFLLNIEAFNMIGSLPVLPGPCQFYDFWPMTSWCTEKLQALGSYLSCSDWCDFAVCYIADRFPFGLMRWCLKTDESGVVIRNEETGMASLADYEKTVVIPIAVISIVVTGCIMIYLMGAFFCYTYLNGFSFFQVLVLLISLCPFILAFLKCEPSNIGVLLTIYIQYTLALLYYSYIPAFYAPVNYHDVSWSSDGTESMTQAVDESREYGLTVAA